MPKLNLESNAPIVCSIGGSMVVPTEKPNVEFLRALKELVKRQTSEGMKFVFVIGGGRTCRNYLEAAESVGDISNDELDWLGIQSTYLNAHLVKTILGDLAYPEVLHGDLPNAFEWGDASVLISGGQKPGQSSDYPTAEIAHKLGATHIINASNIDHVYSEDPRNNPDATPFDEISWADYRGMIPSTWTPGLSAPFDPTASEFCERHHIAVAIVNGEPIDELRHAILGNKFNGTLIS